MSWIEKAMADGLEALETRDRKKMEDYIAKTTQRMKEEGVPSPRRVLKKYKGRMAYCGPSGSYSTPPATDKEIADDINRIAVKLNDWRERLDDPMSAESKYNSNITNIYKPDVHVESSSNSSSNSSISVFAEARKKIDSLDELSIEEATMLKGMLVDIEDCNDDSLGEKIMRAIKFVAEKTFAVALAVLPPIVGKMS